MAISQSFFFSNQGGYVIIRFYRKGRKDHYGFFKFMFDIIATICTAGFWLIWIFVREMRK